MVRLLPLTIVIPALLAGDTTAQPSPDEGMLPTDIALSVQAERAISAPFLSEEETAERRVFHGVWTNEDLVTPRRRARAAQSIYDLTNPAFDDPSIPVEWRAEILVQQGEMERALVMLGDVGTPMACRVRAEAHEGAGRPEAADRALDDVLQRFRRGAFESAADLTEVAQCLMLRSRLRGEPGPHYQEIIELLGRVHQRVDRLYWPARLVEAELLFEKNQRGKTYDVLIEVLQLNPRCAEAWYRMGELALAGYDFDAALEAADHLDTLHERHVLARILRIEADLMQNFPHMAAARIDDLLSEMPRHRRALALRAVVHAIQYDEEAAEHALAALDEIAPGHPEGYYLVGLYLSTRRQYDLAAAMLEEAIRRQPNWPAPHVELGLLKMQAGEDDEALEILRRATTLDPFNARAANSLHLIERLLGFETVRSEHFIVRYDPEGSDRALAVEMLAPLERMYDDVTTAFQHEPDRPTVIELMPNHEWFAVRIAGVPEIHTIAAATGPVIAMESPRAGPGHSGPYDWERVLRHEYVHTITLSTTHNRIPHWFTEAAAVWQEIAPRDFNTCRLLAEAYRAGRLFSLDRINWAFVRPQGPNDRALAYAQGHWMFEFLVERFGHAAMIALLERYSVGAAEREAFPNVLGVSRDDFFTEFVGWAGDQVRAWGMDPSPSLADLVDQARQSQPLSAEAETEQATAFARMINLRVLDLMRPLARFRRQVRFSEIWDDTVQWVRPQPEISSEQIESWLANYPDHPEVLRFRIHAIEREGVIRDEDLDYLHRYLRARPVDPLPHRLLARYYLTGSHPSDAIPHLEEIDRREKYNPSFALELARQYRALGEFEVALDRAERAAAIEPFNAAYRELAAAIAIQGRDFDSARRHLEALTLIEPGRSIHQQRLEALNRLEKGP